MDQTNASDISRLLGLSPADLSTIMAQFQPSEEDKRAARTQAAFAAAAGLLSNMYKPAGMGIGAGLQGGLLGYNAELKDRTTQRGQNIVQAMGIRKAAQEAQSQARRNQWSDQLLGNIPTISQDAQQSIPVQGPSPSGLPQIPAGSLPGINTGMPAQLPQQQGSQSAPGSSSPLVNQLLDMGIPMIAIQNAGASDNPQAAVQQLIKEYNQPHFGQGKLPLIRTREGFKAAPVQGGNEALAAQVMAEESAKQAAANPYHIVEGVDANGRPIKGYAPQLFGLPPIAQQQPVGNGNVSIRGNMTQAQLAEIAKEMAGQPSAFRPVPQFGGGPMAGPDPIEQAAKLGQVASQTAQNTDIAKNFGDIYSKAVQAEYQAPTNIAKYEQMKSYLSNVNTGKAAPTVQKLKAYASYFAPDLAKEWTAETPYAQAATSFANELALQLRNPASGAGMPGNLSNTDRDFLVSMVSSVANDPRAIPIMIDARVALEKRNQDIGKMARSYRVKNGQIDEGFYQEVQNFADTHPLFPKVNNQSSGGWSAKRID